MIARGKDVEKWFNDDQAVGTGGIVSPQPVHLSVGQRYYRFASSTSSEGAQVGGGWWIEYETFRTIETFARSNGYSLGDAARLFLALPHAWTRVDRLVSAFLKVPLKAYRGYGNVATGAAASPRTRAPPGSRFSKRECHSSTFRAFTSRAASPSSTSGPFRIRRSNSWPATGVRSRRVGCEHCSARPPKAEATDVRQSARPCGRSSLSSARSVDRPGSGPISRVGGLERKPGPACFGAGGPAGGAPVTAQSPARETTRPRLYPLFCGGGRRGSVSLDSKRGTA